MIAPFVWSFAGRPGRHLDDAIIGVAQDDGDGDLGMGGGQRRGPSAHHGIGIGHGRFELGGQEVASSFEPAQGQLPHLRVDVGAEAAGLLAVAPMAGDGGLSTPIGGRPPAQLAPDDAEGAVTTMPEAYGHRSPREVGGR